MASQAPQILLENFQRLLRRKADKNLGNMLQRTRAQDIAAIFRSLSDRDRSHTFALIPSTEKQSEVLSFVDPEIASTVVAHIDDTLLIQLLELMSGDDAADIVELLDEDRGARVLAAWKGDEKHQVDDLLAYDPDTAGGIMSPHVFALPADTTARDAITTLQEHHEDLEIAFYLYVVNEHGHLVGVCSLRELVISDARARLSEFMTPEVVSVNVAMDQEEVARLVTRYNFLAVPVVDEANRLVGVITVDDVIDVIREEATEDMLMLAGAGAVDFADVTSPARSARQRMPYLLASFGGGVAALMIINAFQSSLQQVAALAAFIPITLGMGGNVGTQAATLMTRGIALGRISPGRFAATVGREVATGTLLGVAFGLTIGLITTVLYHDDPHFASWQLALTVGLSVAASMTIAATLGGAVPILFHRIGVDPALATGPVVTTSVDILGTTIYFLIGTSLLL